MAWFFFLLIIVLGLTFFYIILCSSALTFIPLGKIYGFRKHHCIFVEFFSKNIKLFLRTLIYENRMILRLASCCAKTYTFMLISNFPSFTPRPSICISTTIFFEGFPSIVKSKGCWFVPESCVLHLPMWLLVYIYQYLVKHYLSP